MVLAIRNSRIRLSQGQIFWREVGWGTRVVFLHGSWSDGSEWLPVVEALGSDYHSCVPDLLGCGESDRPNVHYSIELQAEFLAEYLDVLKLKQVYLIGQGIGGWVAATYALRYPNQVEGLALLGAEGVQMDGGSRWQQERWLTRLPLLAWIVRSLLPLARICNRSDQVQALLDLHQTLKRSPATCQLLFNRRKAEIRAEQLGDRLTWLKLPILILQGNEDDAIVTALNRAYSRAPQTTVQSLPGKNLVETAPEQVAEQIRAFVK